MTKLIGFIISVCFLIILNGCINKIDVRIKPRPSKSISSVSVVNNQIKVTGSNLSGITTLKIKNGGLDETFIVESVSATEVIANASHAVTIGVGQIFDLILNSAEGAATFPVSFSLSNGSVTAVMLSSMGASTGQILKFNGSTWVPTSITSSQTFKGTWNANTNSPDLNIVSPTSGDYYIVSTAGTQGAVTYAVGDYIISNGTVWSKLTNSISFNGRTGAVVPTAGDYNWSQITKTGSKVQDIADVDITGIAAGKVLKWNGTNWIMGTDNGGGTPSAGSVTDLEVSATANIAQSKIQNLVSALSGKEPVISNPADVTKYYRGDKTFQTLNTSIVPESTNLYFTNARVLGLTLTGFSANNAVITAADTVLSAFGKVQGQLNNLGVGSGNYLVKNSTDAITGVVNVGTTGLLQLNYVPVGLTDAPNKQYVDTQVATKQNTITKATVQDVSKVRIYGANTTNYVELSTTALTGNHSLVFPDSNGANGQVLKTDGAGNLTWSADNAGGGSYLGGNNFVVVTNGSGLLSDSTITTAKLNFLTGVTSDIQTQLNSKQSTIDKTITQPVSKVRIYGANATNYVELTAGTLSANRILNFPDTDGSAGNVLTTDGAGNLTWSAAASGGPANTDALLEGSTNLYFTNLRAIGSTITAPVLTNSAIVTGDTVQAAVGKLQAQINNKEGSQAVGTSAQYYRGDKTWQTLDSSIVTENSNLYFTSSRVLAVPLTGFSTNNSAIVLTDSILQAFGKAQGQINNKLDTSSFIDWSVSGAQTVHPSRLSLGAGNAGKALVTDGSGFITSSATTTSAELGYVAGVTSSIQSQLNSKQTTIDKTTVQAVSKLRIYGANATNYVELSTGVLTGNRSLIFPDSNGSTGNLLTTDGAGNLSWTPAAAAGPVNTDALPEGSANFYYTNARGISSTITAPTLTNSAISSGDTLQVTVGKLQAQLDAILARALVGFSAATNAVVTSADSIVVALGKLQAQVSAKADQSNGAQSITASNINVTTINGTAIPLSTQWTTNSSNIYYNTGNVGIGTSSPGSNLDVKGTLRLSGSTSGYVGFSPAATAGSTTYTLPSTQGSAGQFLATDGLASTPTLSWVTPSIGVGAITTLELLDGTILNADISASAAIADTKLATIATGGKVSGTAITSGNINTSGDIQTAGRMIASAASTTTAKLEVSGQILSKVYNSGSSTTIDWNNGNIQYTSANCAAVTFSNMFEGGSYSLIVTGATSGTCTFSQTSPDTLATFKYIPANAATTASKTTIYSFLRAGGVVYVNWSSGY